MESTTGYTYHVNVTGIVTYSYLLFSVIDVSNGYVENTILLNCILMQLLGNGNTYQSTV